jgi:hypothetical protein
VVSSIPGLDLNRVYHLAHPDDAIAIREAALRHGINRIAITIVNGGGFQDVSISGGGLAAWLF